MTPRRSAGTLGAIWCDMKTPTESLASKWEFYWSAYVSALRSGSETRLRIARAELEEVKKEIG